MLRSCTDPFSGPFLPSLSLPEIAEPSYVSGKTMANKSLYVGNISYSATEDSLKAAFAAYSPSAVRIIEGRGFAFVEVAADQMEAAIDAMNGKSVDGRNLTVNEAKPRESGNGRSDDPRKATSGRW